jgi:hypothetical protein
MQYYNTCHNYNKFKYFYYKKLKKKFEKFDSNRKFDKQKRNVAKKSNF